MNKLYVPVLCLILLCGSANAAVAVRMEESAALLNEDGMVIVDAGKWTDIVPLSEVLFAATVDGRLYALMNEQGTVLTEAYYDELRFDSGVLMAYRDGGWGLLSVDGVELTSFDFGVILPDGAGNCWALREGGVDMGVLLLDKFGNTTFTALHAQHWGEPGEGKLALQLPDGLWGYCDTSGMLSIPAEFDWAESFTAGCAAVVRQGYWGAIDSEGGWIIQPEFERVEISEAGFLLASGDGRVSVWSVNGDKLAQYFGEGIWAALVGEDYIICDTESLRVYSAQAVLLEELDPRASVGEGLDGQLVLSEGMWGDTCVRLTGTQIMYQNLYPLCTAGGEPIYACMGVQTAYYVNDMLGEIQLSVDMDSVRYGLVDASGEQLLPCEYLWVDALCDDRFLVRTEKQWQMIDSHGNIYWHRDLVETITSH